MIYLTKEKPMSKPETLKIDEVEYVRKDTLKPQLVVPKGEASNPFLEPGHSYFIQTVTHYFTGRLLWVGPQELAFKEVCWIADTGRFNQFIKGQEANESEPYNQDDVVVIGRGALVSISPRGLILSVK